MTIMGTKGMEKVRRRRITWTLQQKDKGKAQRSIQVLNTAQRQSFSLQQPLQNYSVWNVTHASKMCYCTVNKHMLDISGREREREN